MSILGRIREAQQPGSADRVGAALGHDAMTDMVHPTPEQVRKWEDLYPRVWIGDLCRSWLTLYEENERLRVGFERQAAVLKQVREALMEFPVTAESTTRWCQLIDKWMLEKRSTVILAIDALKETKR